LSAKNRVLGNQGKMLKLMPTSALNAGFILAAVTAPIIDHVPVQKEST